MVTIEERLLSTCPSGKLPFDCQKIAKNLPLPLAIFLKKNENFWQFFGKKCFWQFFDSQMSIFQKVSLGLTTVY